MNCYMNDLGIHMRCYLGDGDLKIVYIRYLTMYKEQMPATAFPIRNMLYGCAYVQEIINPLKLLDYLTVHTHKTYSNFHLYCDFATFPLIYAVPDFRKDHIFSKGGGTFKYRILGECVLISSLRGTTVF